MHLPLITRIALFFLCSFHLEIQTDMSVASFAKLRWLRFIFRGPEISASGGEVLIGFAPPWPIVDDLPETHKLPRLRPGC
jgi:hypothetical protein